MYIYHYAPGASLAPHILLEEIGVRYTPRRLVLERGEHRRPEFLALNSKGMVPVLEHSGFRLTEIPAIMFYLATTHRNSHTLWPESLLDQARCVEWFNWLASTLLANGFPQIWKPERFAASPAAQSEVVKRGEKNILETFAQVEKALSSSGFGVSSGYSVVDPFLFIFFRWGLRAGINMTEQFPRWRSLAEEVSMRPAVARAVEIEEALD